MDNLNQQRFMAVQDQLMSFTAADATPVDSFTIEPTYTLIGSLPQPIVAKMKAFSDELQRHFSDQYYYAPEQYHLTIVPVPHTHNPEDIIRLLAPLLKGWRLPIQVKGFALNRFQVSAVLYPGEETLLPMRQKLRQVLAMPDQDFTEHRSIWEELAWTNFMRFTSSPPSALVKMVQDHAHDVLGDFTLEHFDLYEVSTKTRDPASSVHIHTF
jgi:2'-5' RNA ligase